MASSRYRKCQPRAARTIIESTSVVVPLAVGRAVTTRQKARRRAKRVLSWTMAIVMLVIMNVRMTSNDRRIEVGRKGQRRDAISERRIIYPQGRRGDQWWMTD